MTLKNNLCSDCWIPVTMLDGRAALHSLESLFGQAEHIRDLALSPTERIAVMRLLICIAQRALNGPADEEQKDVSRQNSCVKIRRELRKSHPVANCHGVFLCRLAASLPPLCNASAGCLLRLCLVSADLALVLPLLYA